jgi:hypothetical protein
MSGINKYREYNLQYVVTAEFDLNWIFNGLNVSMPVGMQNSMNFVTSFNQKLLLIQNFSVLIYEIIFVFSKM